MDYPSQFNITSWNEEPIIELSSPQKFNRGIVERTHRGYLKGTETMYYTLLYSNEKSSDFVGIGLFEGHIGDQSGNFSIIERGTYKNGSVVVTFEAKLLTNMDIIIGRGHYETSEHGQIDYVFSTPD